MKTTAAPVDETWNLAHLFEDQETFERAFDDLAARVETLAAWRGRLGDSPATLAEALDTITETFRDLAKLRCYATLRSDTDGRDPGAQAMRQRVEMLGTRVSERISYLRPGILAIDPALIEPWISEEPRLETHRFFLCDLARQRDHVLEPGEERILAESGLVTRSPSAVYNVLNNVELPRREVRLEDGTNVELTPVNFQNRRTTPVRADREKLYSQYFEGYASFRDTLGQNLGDEIRAHLFRSRARRYDSCLAAALDADNVPLTVYERLIGQVRERLPLLHRYFRLRARVLGLERLGYHDLSCPLGQALPRRFSTNEARALVLRSVEALGPEYVRGLEAGFAERWIDWHPAPGKRSGAYATGWAYDVHPYVLLNYTDQYEAVSTLAHEMGHAMHSHFSNARQPFATADCPIFVAEVASTLNEALLLETMLGCAADDEERRYLLAHAIDGLRGTLFRQTMFAEFELDIHRRAEAGEAITGETLCGIYLDLVRDYHGHDAGVVRVDDVYAIEWAGIPHFYYNFYVYQYATGIVASTALAEAVIRSDPGAAERYLEFLSAGGSDYPLAMLRCAGVDLEDAAPYAAAFGALERRLDELERLHP